MQTALLEHAAAYNLRTVMTFHQKVEEAAAFAEQLPKTAAELYVNDASDEDLAAAGRLPRRRSTRSSTSWRPDGTSRRTASGRRGCAATTS
uniref:Uncharacterized protein n=1 Tax=Streptomyces avermitilis TaxID=33903 RepID=A0A499VPR4_STRAX|nr:hypothetical protein SAVMC3_89740 [Streptomyces avermitilis]